MYDIFFVSSDFTKSIKSFEAIKNRFPMTKKASSLEESNRKSVTKFFWIVWDDIEVLDSFNFSYKPDNGSQKYVHVFKNGNSYDGICLVPKNAQISKREIEYRFYINKKEIDIHASNPLPYEIFLIESYDDYLEALQNTKFGMFWMSSRELIIDENFKFDLYFDHSNNYDRNQNHVFINKSNDEEFYDGIVLCSKNVKLSNREIEYKVLVNRKEWNIIASYPNYYSSPEFDIIFISYNEPNADENYEKLRQRFPRSKRIHGVKGIHQAHIAAARLSTTDMFWVVDGDALIVDDFNFDYNIPRRDVNVVHVWQSINPINDLIYGYGGVKLLPKKLTENMNTNSIDMTTSISNRFKAKLSVSNVTSFNTDPFNTWKSAFRECVKLSSRSINGQIDQETTDRLNIWCTVGIDSLYGEYAIKGACAGKEFGLKYSTDKSMLSKINDWEWLTSEFNKL